MTDNKSLKQFHQKRCLQQLSFPQLEDSLQGDAFFLTVAVGQLSSNHRNENVWRAEFCTVKL